MSTTQYREDKLPKWAQERLANERRKAVAARDALLSYCDDQTPGPIWHDQLVTSSNGSPDTVRVNINGTDHVEFDNEGVRCRIQLTEDGIRVSAHPAGRLSGDVAFLPLCDGVMVIKNPRHMRIK